MALYVDQATSKALWGGLAILCFVTTCYRVWLREHRLLAQLTNALPRIVFCEVRSGELYSQAPSKEFIVQAWFKNIPASPTETSVARNVTAAIEIQKSDGRRLDLVGLWIESSAPTNIGIEKTYSEINVPPNDIPVKLGIAVKHRGDLTDNAYPILAETMYRQFVHPDFAIEPGSHYVTVRLNGVGVREKFTFMLLNVDQGDLALSRVD